MMYVERSSFSQFTTETGGKKLFLPLVLNCSSSVRKPCEKVRVQMIAFRIKNELVY